jgi:hypothetical protein
VEFAASSINPCYQGPNCGYGASGTGMTSGTSTVPCVPGQDTPIECSQCLSFSVCNPPLVPIPGQCLLDAGGGG